MAISTRMMERNGERVLVTTTAEYQKLLSRGYTVMTAIPGNLPASPPISTPATPGGTGAPPTTSAGDLTSGTLSPSRLADNSVPFGKMTGTLSDAQIPASITRDTELSSALNALVGAAPGTLDTLAEIATALQADEAGATALAALVAQKASTVGPMTQAAYDALPIKDANTLYVING